MSMPHSTPSGTAFGPSHDAVKRSPGQAWLVLGLGPDPTGLAESLPRDAIVDYMECPACFDQTAESWRAAIPAAWRRVEDFEPRAYANILMHGQALQLFPDFWAPVGAALALPCPARARLRDARLVLAAAESSRLVVAEALQALEEQGFQVLPVGPDMLVPVLEECRPELFFSVNFAGLDPYGAAWAVLARAEVPVAVWCVDNPLHTLSSLQSGFWREVHLFVTDDWFIAPLRRMGAKHVHHLPLAATPAFFQATLERAELSDWLLFVGHSAFANKQAFFSGHNLPTQAFDAAQAMLEQGQRPDFAWWTARLGMEEYCQGVAGSSGLPGSSGSSGPSDAPSRSGPLVQPGRHVRRAGLGAEECSLAWRAMVLAGAARAGSLAVCGDNAWRDLVDAPFTLLPPVDYYGPLAGMYASARAVIGTTSLLLPHGLTQRHFDVWAAGGCLLTDNTPGLALFPEELTKPVTFRTPGDIPKTLACLERERPALSAAWRDLLSREHTYGRRIATLLERVLS